MVVCNGGINRVPHISGGSKLQLLAIATEDLGFHAFHAALGMSGSPHTWSDGTVTLGHTWPYPYHAMGSKLFWVRACQKPVVPPPTMVSEHENQPQLK